MSSPEIRSFSRSGPEFVEEFSSAQERLRKDPYRKGILPAQMAAMFLKLPVPFAREFWIVKSANPRGGHSVVGRIGANISATDPSKGYIGFYEVDLDHPEAGDISKSLLTQARSWLREQGAKTAYGPLNFNTWFPYRFRTDIATERQFAWEPVNPPQYVSFWLEDGWKEEESYHSHCMGDLKKLAEGTQGAYDRAVAAGYRIRALDSAQLAEREIPILYKISMAGFKDNFLFEPIRPEMFSQLYVGIAAKADLGLANIVESPSGSALGFFFAFQDGEYHVMKSIAMAPEARGLGLSNAIMHASVKEALKRGLTQGIGALVRSGAQSESYSKKTTELWRHEYALYSREVN